MILLFFSTRSETCVLLSLRLRISDRVRLTYNSRNSHHERQLHLFRRLRFVPANLNLNERNTIKVLVSHVAVPGSQTQIKTAATTSSSVTLPTSTLCVFVNRLVWHLVVHATLRDFGPKQLHRTRT